ncbi:MAG TPA: hypothetical protein VD998_01830 [Verrucomicrobiae bacterium]|nr:hypothetical protein [Verrucomicrobiae bacterium]
MVPDNAANDTTFTDSTVTPGNNYWYRVTAFNGSGQSIHTQAGPANPLDCVADLSSSVKTITHVNGAPYTSATTINAGDILEFQITLINQGPSNAEINYICDHMSPNLIIINGSLEVSGGGNNGGMTANSPTCGGANHHILRANGIKAPGNPNWIVSYQARFNPVTNNTFEVCANNADINYDDNVSGRVENVPMASLLCKTGKGGNPRFREVIP